MSTTQQSSAVPVEAAIDPAVYREVMGHYPTGVTVVTAMEGDEPIGMVVGTFSSVSMDPPLVAFMPTTSSGTYARLARATSYCINVLAHDQQALCRTMAIPSDDKFAGVEWRRTELGAPALDDAVAHIHCTPESEIEAGDHYIVLCRVQAMEVSRPATPLLFFQGGYGGFSPGGMTARGDADLIAALRLSDTARIPVERLARQLGCEAAVLVGVGLDELTTAFSAYGGCSSMVEQYRTRLAAVARRGVAISLIDSDSEADYARLSEALQEYAAGELTPARERAFRGLLAQTRCFFQDHDLVPSQNYRVGGIVVPVRNPEGDISMVLRVTQLPADADGTTVESWVARVKQAAATVERELAHGAGQGRLRAYRDWYDADFPM